MRHPRLVLAIFVLSGAAGLMYEVVWSRQLVLVFGSRVFRLLVFGSFVV